MNIITPFEFFESTPSRSAVTVSCDFCKKHFQRMKKHVLENLKTKSPIFCNRECSRLGRIKLQEFSCKECSSKVIRREKELGKNVFCSSSCSAKFYNRPRIKPKIAKRVMIPNPLTERECSNCLNKVLRRRSQIENTKFSFCSRRCQAIFANKTYNRAGRFGKNRSKAEDNLADIISQSQPLIKISKNDRTILPNGLEFDLFLPEYNIAIELNGPCHYIPIFGTQELTKTQSKDLLKLQFCQKHGIRFITVNIMSAGRRLPAILQSAFSDFIEPLILADHARLALATQP